MKENLTRTVSMEQVLIEELDNNFIYEIQHIPYRDKSVMKYFKNFIIESFLSTALMESPWYGPEAVTILTFAPKLFAIAAGFNVTIGIISP